MLVVAGIPGKERLNWRGRKEKKEQAIKRQQGTSATLTTRISNKIPKMNTLPMDIAQQKRKQ
jgi:hypothetical protein